MTLVYNFSEPGSTVSSLSAIGTTGAFNLPLLSVNHALLTPLPNIVQAYLPSPSPDSVQVQILIVFSLNYHTNQSWSL